MIVTFAPSNVTTEVKSVEMHHESLPEAGFRDPVDRFISAYNSNACLYGGDSRQTCVRPNNLQSDLPIMRLSMPMPGVAEAAAEEMLNIKDPHGALGCFPNVTAFAEHLDDDSDCGRAARDVMHPPWAVHVKMGPCYYLGGLIHT